MEASELIETAAKQLGELLYGRVDFDLRPTSTSLGKEKPDALLSLKLDQDEYVFAVETKKHVNIGTVGYLADRAEEIRLRNEDFLLVTEYVRPAVGEALRKQGVSYVDAVGNCHIDHAPLLLHVEGRKQVRKAFRERVRAFNGEGLKVIFPLLLLPEFAAHSYRDLVELSGVSQGVVQYTMKDLEKLGFLLRLGRRERRLRNTSDLLDRWTEGFIEVLRPRLIIDRFRFRSEEQWWEWKNIRLDSALDRWGGEPAAAIITDYLKPAVLTLYTRESKPAIMKKLRVVPDPEGRVEVLKTFWTRHLEEALSQEFSGRAVPTLLAYADLSASQDPRNAEVATMLRDQLQTG